MRVKVASGLAAFCLLMMVVPSAATATLLPDAPDSNNGSAATTVKLQGYENPPGYQPAVNPCAGNEDDFTQFVSRKTNLVKAENEDVAIEVGGDGVLTIEADGSPSSLGFHLDLETEFEVEFIEWLIACAKADDENLLQPGSAERFWVRVPTHTTVVPSLLAELLVSLAAPEVTWPDEDEEHGWLYVNAPMDFRVTPTNTVRLEATISNVAGSVSAWVEGTPDSVTFDPGEPGGQRVTCTYDEAIAPYDIEEPGECAYTYSSSSGIADGDVFVGRTTIFWAVSSSAPLTVNDAESWREQQIAVAEIQAISVANP